MTVSIDPISPLYVEVVDSFSTALSTLSGLVRTTEVDTAGLGIVSVFFEWSFSTAPTTLLGGVVEGRSSSGALAAALKIRSVTGSMESASNDTEFRAPSGVLPLTYPQSAHFVIVDAPRFINIAFQAFGGPYAGIVKVTVFSRSL